MLFKTLEIRTFERGLRFVRGEFDGLVEPGRVRTWFVRPHVRIAVVDVRDVWLRNEQLDVIARSGALDGVAEVIDLADHERAIVRVDGRLDRVLQPGLHVAWTAWRDVQVERVDARDLEVRRELLAVLLASTTGRDAVESLVVPDGHAGLVYSDGELARRLEPGRYGFWKGESQLRLVLIDLRDVLAEVVGQELMTKDRVTLRINATVTYAVTDPVLAVGRSADFRQALYRDAQLALREVVGTRDLDALLADKAGVGEALDEALRPRAAALGVELRQLGIRDVILPGEMKELLNKVTEARKAAEAAVITRREETAAMRSQANTARLLADNPTLMRMRELEVLERVAAEGDLTVVLGEQGLGDRVLKLL